MSIWKFWLLMSQSLPQLVNYKSYLPTLVWLLNHIFPPSLSRLICHGILISPIRHYFLRSMLNNLKFECGACIFYQSHKNILKQKSLEMFLRMALLIPPNTEGEE
ncbi:hypothetical protein VP01_2752g3 [Puccinia sorghi]|uniref:Uncharacterized protein n=1 Tax=Puccinia sorghi TaxID=27349 RepID=A0A0L6V4U2_9BASI|nr:hypothetical protein VP01_2752g3 [Puccinia sorghi]